MIAPAAGLMLGAATAHAALSSASGVSADFRKAAPDQKETS
jgi:hypothetical protein